MKRVWTAVSWGAVALAGCQASPAARRPTDIAQKPVELDRKEILDEAARRPPSKVGVGSKLGASEAKVRLVAADESDLHETAPATVPVAGLAQLTLDSAIETGLMQNPDLIALRQAEGVSEAALGVAQTYPFNPWVQIRTTPYERDAQGGSPPTFHYVLLQQNLQLAHQQQFREEIGASQLNQVRWNIHNLELLNAAQTARLYFTALYQRGIRELTRASAELNQQLLRVSETRSKAGDISDADIAIVRLDAQSTKQQADLAEANYQTALLDLRRQLNIPLDTQIELTGDLTTMRWQPARQAALSQIGSGNDGATFKIGSEGEGDADLIKRIADGRPDIMASRADIQTAYASYRLANAMRTPDLLFGPFYQRDDFATVFFGFQAQMDIPVMNNGQPLTRQRAAEHCQRQITWQQLQARAEIEAVASVDRFERARRLVDAALPGFKDDLPAELKRLEAQFEENEADVLRVFQARTSLIQSRRAALDLMNELAQATAAVTAATGIPPTTLLAPAEPGGGVTP